MRFSNKITRRTISTAVLCAVVCNAFCIAGVYAAPLAVTKDSAGGTQIETRVKTDAIGMLKVPNGAVKISGNNVSVSAVPDWLFDRHVMLTGRLLKHNIGTAAGKTSISGLIYFLEGDWINSLPEQKIRDNMTLTNGNIQVGRLRTINDDYVDFQIATGQTRRFKLSEIASIDSPRAFTFTLPAQNVKVDPATGAMTADASDISFDQTVGKKARRFLAKKGPEEPRSTLAGTEGGVTKGQIAGMVTLDVINTLAPAIIAPIVGSMGANSATKELRAAGIEDQNKNADTLR